MEEVVLIKNNNFLIYLLSILLLISVLIAGFFAYQTQKLVKEITKLETPVACTKEAKICPDGSSVGRSGPKCEFVACPAPKN